MPRKWLTSKRKGKTDEKIVVDEVELKTIEVRLNSVKDATNRSRFIFLMMTVISASILLVLWNTTFSWEKGKSVLPKFNDSDITISEKELNDKLVEPNAIENFSEIIYEKLKKIGNESEQISKELVDKAIIESAKEIAKEKLEEKLKAQKLRVSFNQDEAIREWIKNRVISIGLLGIRISVTDLAVVGSLSLLIITIWFFFCIRRENRAIVTLLRDIYEDWRNKDVSSDICRMVYYGVVNNLVFIDMRGGDEPIGGLQRLEQNISAIRIRLLVGMTYLSLINERREENLSITEGTQKSIEARLERISEFFYLLLATEKKKRTPFVRKVISVLVFLPPITILVIVVSDIYSLTQASPFRDLEKPFWMFINEQDKWLEYILKMGFFDGCATLTGIYSALICWRCRVFSKNTANTIVEFRRKTKVE